MNCDCPECRALADDIRANAEVLAALRDEPLPVTRMPRKSTRWRLAFAAAALLAVSLPIVRHTSVAPMPEPQHSEPLKVKLLTPDPDVVIYWLIEPKENHPR
jgi:hypothetical protein